jgi:hypothetical protein
MREIEIDRGTGYCGSVTRVSPAKPRLVMREGEGHFGIYEHLGEMLGALTEPAPAGAG